MPAHHFEDAVDVLGRYDPDQLPFVGDVERIEPQHLAGAADLGATGMAASSSRTPTREAVASSFRALDTPPRVGSRMARIAGQASSIARIRPVSGRVALQNGLEFDPFAHRHDGDPVVADRPRDQMRSPGRAS